MQCMIVPVTPFQQNCSILKCPETGDIAVIDPGGDLDRIDEAVKQLGGKVSLVLLPSAVNLKDFSLQSRLLMPLGVSYV